MCRARLPTDPSSFMASLPDGTNATLQKINLSHLDDNTFPQVIISHHFEKQTGSIVHFQLNQGVFYCEKPRFTTCLTENLQKKTAFDCHNRAFPHYDNGTRSKIYIHTKSFFFFFFLKRTEPPILFRSNRGGCIAWLMTFVDYPLYKSHHWTAGLPLCVGCLPLI